MEKHERSSQAWREAMVDGVVEIAGRLRNEELTHAQRQAIYNNLFDHLFRLYADDQAFYDHPDEDKE